MRCTGSIASVGVLVIFSIPTSTFGHHSRVEFQETTQAITGELVSVSWTNPHVTLQLRVTDEQGRSSVWHLEGWNSPYILRRTGVTEADLVPGDVVTVAGRASGRRANTFLLTHLLRPDGTEVILAANLDPFFGARQLGGIAQWSTERADTASVTGDRHGIFRTWSVEYIYAEKHDFPYTEQAIQSREGWDELDSFVVNCDPRGVPLILWENPWPFEFIDEGDRYLIRYQYLGNVRTVHMNSSGTDTEPAPSRLGYSVGHWEGDTLIVETSRISWPYFDVDGTRVSDQLTTEERFILGPDGQSLQYQVTFYDSETFTRPATHEQNWLDLGETVEPSSCKAG